MAKRKLSAVKLNRQRVERVESTAVELLHFAETYEAYDKCHRRYVLLAKARAYAAAIRALGGQR